MTLYEAIRNHDSNEVKTCLESGSNLFEKNVATGLTPFELCCLMGDSGVKNAVFYHLHQGQEKRWEKEIEVDSFSREDIGGINDVMRGKSKQGKKIRG